MLLLQTRYIFVTYPGVGPPSPRLKTCLGLSKYWNLWSNLVSEKKPDCHSNIHAVFIVYTPAVLVVNIYRF